MFDITEGSLMAKRKETCQCFYFSKFEDKVFLTEKMFYQTLFDELCELADVVLRRMVIINRSGIVLCFSVVTINKLSPSTIAELVRDLIKLASMLTHCGDDRTKAVQYEVANCLGEIGAVDLETVSLGCKKKGNQNAPSFKLYCCICNEE